MILDMDIMTPSTFIPSRTCTLFLGKSICTWTRLYPSLMLYCFATFLNSWWIFLLFLIHVMQISVFAYTTNETINWMRFDYLFHPEDTTKPIFMRRRLNPFNMGYWLNCLDFWCEGVVLNDVSWFNIYEVPTRLYKGKR
jgi:hypothetical protein